MKNLSNIREFLNFLKKEEKDEVIEMIGKSIIGLKNLPIVHDFRLSKKGEDYIIRIFLNKNDEFGDGTSMLYMMKPINQYQYELKSFGSKFLNPASSIINFSDIESNLLSMIQNDIEVVSLKEDGGVSVAVSGTTSGMGNVTSAQPASTPGATVTGDGTTGSGDYGNPLFKTSQKDGSKTLGKKKGKKNKKKESVIQDFIAQYKAGKKKNGSTTSVDGTKSSKMLSFSDFVNNDIKK